MKYNEYINSDEWRNKSNSYLNDNPICEICNKYLATDVHHKSYKNFGNESEEDLQALCQRCHFGLHDFPPFIKDAKQRNKAMKIINYFKLYPSIKTLVLNDVSRAYFDNRFMIDVAKESFDDTPMFNQNLMEIFYDRGLEINEDIIEFVLARCIRYKYEAGRNSYNKTLLKTKHKTEILNSDVTTSKKIENILSDDEKLKIKISRYCLSVLSDREALKTTKSYFNRKYYEGKVIFNNVGAKTPSGFIVKISNDNLLNELFTYLGGSIDEF